MGYVFDGVNRKIQLTGGTTAITVKDMWSRWIDWLLTSDNSKYPLAMRNVGGDPRTLTQSLGVTFFLINGWRIVPQSADHRLTIDGNIGTDPAGFSPVDTVPGYSIVVEYSVSNIVDTVAPSIDEVGSIVFDEQNIEVDPNNPEVKISFRQAMRAVLATLAGKLSGANGTTIYIRNALIDNKDRVIATVDANGNRTNVVLDLTD